MERQWALLRSEKKNFIILLGQPVVIGLLVAWMSDVTPLKLFIAYLATFWFGCGNAAQEIVEERAIYRRERLIGLERWHYLASKFLFWGVATLLQTIVLFVCIHFGKSQLEGSPDWQLASLIATSLSSVGIGFALSAWVKTTTQAVFLVPLILLPQIVFSGYVIPFADVVGTKKLVCEVMPSFASQKVMDTSLFWKETVTPSLVGHAKNREDWNRQRPWLNVDPNHNFKMGDEFNAARPALLALLQHGEWVVISYVLAWIGLFFQERAR
jgi:hypothetical protein